jgi:hypothetical protein
VWVLHISILGDTFAQKKKNKATNNEKRKYLNFGYEGGVHL